MGNAEGSNGKSNDELVDNLVKNEVVKKKEIELVMRLVDRGRFVPDAQRRAAYRDVAWKSETGGPGFLHLSAPCIYASVLENLKVEKGMSFLNIGSGTGYLSTMVGFLLGESGVNHGFELYENVLDFSLTCMEKTLMSPEVSAFEWCKPLFFNGNAFQVKTEMRYDRIYCGALVPHSRRSYFCNFLKVGGILVVPYGHLLQRIVRQSETQFVVYDVSSVVFSQLVFPNQENGFTMRQLEIPLLKAPRLTDICRNKIRHCIREAVNSSGIYPLQMRYQCLKPVEQRSDESGSTSTELDPFRQPPARRNRIPLWIVGRANMLLFDREAPIDELDEEVGPQGDFEQRPEPNANPRHFLAMIGERIARHQRARARNAAAEPNLFPEDLIMAQEEEQRDVHPAAEVTPLGEQKMLDDRYFELNMGFRFKRGRTEEDNEEIFENLRFVPRDRINIVDVMNVDGNMDLAHGLDMDLAHDEPQNNVAFDDVADRDQRNQEQGPANQEEAEVVHAIIVDDEELEDGVGHALDDPLDEEDVHVLDESFAADSDATYEIVDESLEEQQEIEADADIRSESGGSDDQSSSSDDEVNSERGDDGANISEDDLQRRLGQNDHLDDDEHDADQTEGARLQALHLANFHEEFLSRLDALPLSSTMLAYVKSREAAFNNQSSDNASSSADDMESRLEKIIQKMRRVLNVFLASTWFVPDESFQSVEVAFKMVYGKGFLTWEWHPDIALRSAVHPTIADMDFNFIANVLARIDQAEQVVAENDKPQQLLNHELQSAPIAVAPSLSKSAVRKQVIRVRIKHQIPVVEARRVEDVNIPAASQIYITGTGGQEQFLLGDSGADGEDSERVLLFGRERNINWSAEMQVIYMDGTFSITPEPFAQVYVILAERSARVDNGGKWVFPVLYALLKNKSRTTYLKLFRMIRNLWPDFRPTSFSVDFELAAIQALQEIFPGSLIAGCFYHLMRNFKKCIANNNLTIRYRDPEFSIQARMIVSLAFVPTLDVWNCLAQLEAYLPAELSPVLDYFSHYYVVVTTTFLLYATNWFLLYCSTRTLSNTIETALTIMALNWYQSSQLCQMDYGKKSEEENILCKPQVKWCDYCFYILHAAFAVIVRPTAVLIWVPLYLVSFYESLHKFSYLRYSLLRCSILCGLAALLISFIVDLFYYGSPTLCLWNFAKFNLLQGGSAHFGANVWFWYFINGLPSVFTIQCLPLFILLVKKLWIAPVSSATGLTVAAKLCRKELPTRYFWTSVFYVTVHSLIAHKEHRFLLPVIPLLMPYLVVEMNDFLNASANFNVPNRFLIFIKRIINSSIILLNCGLALYFGLVHQRGPHAAANFVFSQILEPNPNTTVQILQLMPCFSMPQHYSLHPHSADIKMLDCTASLESMRSQSEELVNGQVEEYREDSYDEADQFHNDPLGWIRDNWPLIKPSAEAISVVIAYEKTFRRIESFLEKKNYKVVKSIFHGHFLTSSNQDSTILISVKTDNL